MLGIAADDIIWADQRGRYFRGPVQDSNEHALRYSEIAVSYLIHALGSDGYIYVARQVFPVNAYHQMINADLIPFPLE